MHFDGFILLSNSAFEQSDCKRWTATGNNTPPPLPPPPPSPLLLPPLSSSIHPRFLLSLLLLDGALGAQAGQEAPGASLLSDGDGLRRDKVRPAPPVSRRKKDSAPAAVTAGGSRHEPGETPEVKGPLITCCLCVFVVHLRQKAPRWHRENTRMEIKATFKPCCSWLGSFLWWFWKEEEEKTERAALCVQPSCFHLLINHTFSFPHVE